MGRKPIRPAPKKKTMQQASTPDELRSNYVRVVLAHKDWLAGQLSTPQMREVLRAVRRDLEQDHNAMPRSDKDGHEEILDLVRESLADSAHGIELMLSALEHEDRDEVLEGLSFLARATVALSEGQSQLQHLD